MFPCKIKFLSETLICFLLGEIQSGFLPESIISEIIRSPNPNSEKCSTDNGITKLTSDIAVLTIQNGRDKIT